LFTHSSLAKGCADISPLARYHHLSLQRVPLLFATVVSALCFPALNWTFSYIDYDDVPGVSVLIQLFFTKNSGKL